MRLISKDNVLYNDKTMQKFEQWNLLIYYRAQKIKNDTCYIPANFF